MTSPDFSIEKRRGWVSTRQKAWLMPSAPWRSGLSNEVLTWGRAAWWMESVSVHMQWRQKVCGPRMLRQQHRYEKIEKVVLVEMSKSGVNQCVLIRVTCSPAPRGYDDATGQQRVPLFALSAPFELTETSSRHYRDLVLHLQICDGVCAHLNTQVKKKKKKDLSPCKFCFYY